MQIDSLRYFVELARAGSFYSAAKSVFISQQGLNKAVKALETELGVKLVERERRGVRLTKTGEAFLGHAQTILADYDAMLNDLFKPNAAGVEFYDPITVHVSYYGAQVAAGDPGHVSMLVSSATYREEPFDELVAKAASSDGSDLVFLDVHTRSLTELLENPDVVFDPVFATHIGFVWKDGSPLASESLLHRDDIAKMPLVYNAFPEMARNVENTFEGYPFADVRMRATSPRMLLEYVQSSDGVIAAFDSFGFFLSELDANMPTAGLHFTPLSTPKGLSQVGFLYPRHAKLKPRAQQAVSAVKDLVYTRCARYFDMYQWGRMR